MVLWFFLSKKKKNYKKYFTSITDNISNEQYLPHMSALLVIIKHFSLPKHRPWNTKLEEACLQQLIVMTIVSNLTASAPKHKWKIKVALDDRSRGKKLSSETCLPAASVLKLLICHHTVAGCWDEEAPEPWTHQRSEPYISSVNSGYSSFPSCHNHLGNFCTWATSDFSHCMC